ncbi:MAG: hypothetical protein QM669_13730 [Siphonobacter sp.]
MQDTLVSRLQEIPIHEVIEDLGYQMNAYGKIRCPFLEETTPSLHH